MTTDFFPTLNEDVLLEPASLINGADQSDLTISAGAGDATITFQGGLAGSSNIIGVYLIGDDGEIQSPKIVFSNAKQTDVGEAVGLHEIYNKELLANQKFGLFLIEHGAVKNAGLGLDRSSALKFFKDGTRDAATIKDESPPVLVLDETEPVLGQIYHTADPNPEARNSDSRNPNPNPLNPDGKEHVVSGLDVDNLNQGIKFGFEDLIDRATAPD